MQTLCCNLNCIDMFLCFLQYHSMRVFVTTFMTESLAPLRETLGSLSFCVVICILFTTSKAQQKARTTIDRWYWKKLRKEQRDLIGEKRLKSFCCLSGWLLVDLFLICCMAVWTSLQVKLLCENYFMLAIGTFPKKSSLKNTYPNGHGIWC